MKNRKRPGDPLATKESKRAKTEREDDDTTSANIPAKMEVDPKNSHTHTDAPVGRHTELSTLRASKSSLASDSSTSTSASSSSASATSASMAATSTSTSATATPSSAMSTSSSAHPMPILCPRPSSSQDATPSSQPIHGDMDEIRYWALDEPTTDALRSTTGIAPNRSAEDVRWDGHQPNHHEYHTTMAELRQRLQAAADRIEEAASSDDDDAEVEGVIEVLHQNPPSGRMWSGMLPFLFGEVRYRSEELHGTHTSRTAFSLPIWTVLCAILLFLLYSVTYPQLMAEFDENLATETKKIAEADLNGAYHNLTQVAIDQECHHFQSKPGIVQGVVQSYITAHVWCHRVMPSMLAPMFCPSPYPDGIAFYIMSNPFESWVLPMTLLYAPRITLLYILIDPRYDASYLSRSTWFWFKWILFPNIAAAQLVFRRFLTTYPIPTIPYILCCFKSQLHELKQVIQGPIGSIVFVMMDGLLCPTVSILVGLFTPTLGLLMLLTWWWVYRVYNAACFWTWMETPIRPPVSRWWLQAFGQYLFSVYQQEAHKLRAANYPFNYTEEPTSVEDLQCIICYSNKKDTVLIPCCHVLCKPCSDRLPKTECPLCLRPFKYMQFIRVN